MSIKSIISLAGNEKLITRGMKVQKAISHIVRLRKAVGRRWEAVRLSEEKRPRKMAG